MPKVSIVIPAFSNNGLNQFLIPFALRSIAGQTFKDIETIVIDQSEDDETEKVCNKWKDIINLKYYRNRQRRGYFGANYNNGIKHATGEIIKMLDEDDFLLEPRSLQLIVDAFDSNTEWLATDYFHTYDRMELINHHTPTINPKIYIANTIGTQCCVAVRNHKDLPLFDKTLKYYADCEWYARMIKKYGNPKVLPIPTIVHYLWGGQATNTVANSQELRNKEIDYVLSIYEP